MATLAAAAAAQEKPKYDLHAFGQKMSDPGMAITRPAESSSDPAAAASLVEAEQEGAVTLRVFAGKALVSPGALYKSVVATPQMTAMEIIRRALERYGEKEKPEDFHLVYRKADDDLARRGSFSKLFGGKPRTHILCDDECPVLVAEWFNDAPRRFELMRKSEAVPKRWSAENMLGSMRRKSKERSSTHIWTINRDGAAEGGSGSDRGGDSPVPTS